MTTLSPAEFIGLITLGPAVFAALILVLGLARRLTRPWALGLCLVGALLPVVGLPFLAPEVAFGDPIAVRPFGSGSGFAAWIAPTYRIDAFALAAALGVAYLITPLIVWMTAAERAQGAQAQAAPSDGDGTAPAAAPSGEAGAPDHAPGDAPGAKEAKVAPSAHDEPDPRKGSGSRAPATRPLILTLGLVLGLEAATLTFLFADSLVLTGIAWILVVALGWALGEAGSDAQTLDRPGLLAMLPGPVLWLIIMLVPAISAHAPNLIDLTGRSAINAFETVLLAVALALAGGAYPAITWVRRRAALATPAGLAAVVLVILPAAVYIAARTHDVAADSANQWPLFTPASQPTPTPPPINAGIAFAVLGTATVVVCALLALGRRDSRALVALTAASQVGWGLVAIGAGRPASVLAVVLLLAVATLGLGAMLAALVAGGVLTSDFEPDADGPRPVGAPARPIALAAWSIGAAGLVGVPFLAGFAPRHLIAAGALEVGTLTIPLVGLCWAGDVVLGLALLRATAPALTTWITDPRPQRAREAIVGYLPDVPGLVLAALALLAGVSPALLVTWFGTIAATPLLVPDSLRGHLGPDLAGYTSGSIQWLSGLAWLAAAAIVALVVLVVRAGPRRSSTQAFRGGLAAGERAETTADGAPAASSERATEEAQGLSAPEVAWSDIQPAFDSPWTLPAGEWLLSGIDDGDTDGDTDGEEARAANGTEEDHGVALRAKREEAPRGEQ